MLTFITQFGHSFVLLALGGALALWLAHSAGRRAALAWLAALLACVSTIAALKVYFMACPSATLDLRSPSGHAGFSMFVYGGITLCLARDETPWRRRWLPPLGLAWIAAIAWSRYALRAHSGTETLLGLGVGALALGAFVVAAGAQPRYRFPFLAASALAAALAVPLTLLNARFTFEPWLQALAQWGHAWLPFCAVGR